MPKRDDLSSILIIGAGPIVIGQACEFDYSGAQAVKALREEGYRVILVNSNPATIMTDPDLTGEDGATYIEPITPEIVERIIEIEKPDALLPTMGGQTALNTGLELAKRGVLDKHGVTMIGAVPEAIEKAEDRLKFRKAMDKIGLESPRSMLVTSPEQAEEALGKVGLPAIFRPSFTLGGQGGGIAYNRQEFMDLIESGLRLSPVSETLVEESVLGWKEYEMEVVRDKADNAIIICSIENIDPMGIHTGDSVTVAPALTLTDKEYQIMRNASIAVLREIGVETGGSNVQFALNPDNGRMVVIEMNPRVSRSSALASKATGFPIAKIAAKLAVGYTLDELDNDITRVTPASFEPTIDYVVTKIPRFTFEKFAGAEAKLTTSMKSVGEAMAIGRNFHESLQKALASMETGLNGLNEIEIPDAVQADGSVDQDAVMAFLRQPKPDRLLAVAQALRLGLTEDQIHEATKIDPWFIARVGEIVAVEAEVRANGIASDKDHMALKNMGFTHERLIDLVGGEGTDAPAPTYRRIDTCAAEFDSQTNYFYSSHEALGWGPVRNEAVASDRDKIMILGGGPNRIGQGIEFDYCCVHAAYALKDAGYETIMVNCNPETVSTDYDTSDRLYFEPLTAESVINIAKNEAANGTLKGVVVQFGGQTPLKLAAALEAAGVPILGTSPASIDLAEDRDQFQQLLQRLDLKQPRNGIARSAEEAEAIAERIGYPVLLRPSYVLGGRAMEVVNDLKGLQRYITEAVKVSGDTPVLIDSYLRGAIEVDVDALCDREGNVVVAGIMQHFEEAGVHSGDSACCLPPHTLSDDVQARIREQTAAMGRELNVQGLMNVQYAVKNDEIYVIEVNPRASRTVPFVAKATGVPVAKIAARLMAGELLSDFDISPKITGQFAVKEAVFPFDRFPGVDTVLGPEMKSTGEVMGMDAGWGRAFLKAQMAAGMKLPTAGTVFVSVREEDKPKVAQLAQHFADEGMTIMATSGTAKVIRDAGIDVQVVNKVREGQPHCVDAMINGDVALVVNTVEGAREVEESKDIRSTALAQRIPYFTTMPGASAAARAIRALRAQTLAIRSLQDYMA